MITSPVAPNYGDLFPIRIAGQSLFVTRDEDDRVRVFYNLCRHRGARLVDEVCHARGGRIACPYHGWTYGIDGQLKTAPHLHRGAKEGPLDPAEMDDLLVEPDSSQVIVLRPQSPGVTSETFANYIVSDASLAQSLAEERAEVRRSSLEVNDQDAALLAGLQLTRSMDVAGATQPSEAWDVTNQRFQRIWAQRLLSGR